MKHARGDGQQNAGQQRHAAQCDNGGDDAHVSDDNLRKNGKNSSATVIPIE
jgi:hypothetical protein